MKKLHHLCLQLFSAKVIATVSLLLGLNCFQLQVLAQQVQHRPDTVPVNISHADTFNEAEETSPQPFDGMMNFYHFIGRRLTFDNTTAQQRAIVAFVVEKNGALTHIRILKSSMSDEMNAQIIRAIYLSPAWRPGTQNGQPVRVQFTFPVTNY